MPEVEPTPTMVTLIHLITYKMGGYSDAPDVYVSVAMVIPEGCDTVCLYVLDPEEFSTFEACLLAGAETFVSSSELIPYLWYQRLLERPTGPAEWLERVQ